MNRARRRTPAIRIEALEPRIALSGDGLPSPDAPIDPPTADDPAALIATTGMADQVDPAQPVDPLPDDALPVEPRPDDPVMTIQDDGAPDDLMVRTIALRPTDPVALNLPPGTDPDAWRGPIDPRILAARPDVSTQIEALRAGLRSPRPSRATEVVGSLRGTATPESNQEPIDGGVTSRLAGQGRVGPFGRVSVSGSLLRNGLVPPGSIDTSGTLTLTGARGSLTLQVAGSSVDTTPSGGLRLEASILDATGSYQDLRGLGTATLRLAGGSFSLGLSLAPPRR